MYSIITQFYLLLPAHSSPTFLLNCSLYFLPYRSLIAPTFSSSVLSTFHSHYFLFLLLLSHYCFLHTLFPFLLFSICSLLCFLLTLFSPCFLTTLFLCGVSFSLSSLLSSYTDLLRFHFSLFSALLFLLYSSSCLGMDECV